MRAMTNSFDPTQLLRPEILALHAYHVPPAQNMIKLDAMENPYVLPSELSQRLAKLAVNVPINRYPDADAVALKKALRQALAISDDMAVMLGNGSDELIQIIAMAVAKPGAVLMSVEPAFVMFRMIATYVGLQYVGVPLKADFSLDLDAMLTEIARQQPAVIFLAYPNNPTGNLFDASAMTQIIEAAPGLVVIDEAYHAFADVSFMDQLARHPNLLLMRTLSKLGLAGLRLGFLVGHPEWLFQLEKLRLPYNIGIMTQVIAQEVLAHIDVLWAQAAVIKQERHKVDLQLKSLDAIEAVFPSDANFILFRINDAKQVFEALKQKGILIKNLDGSHLMLKDCLRVTIGTPEENAQFCDGLRAILK